MEELVRLSQLVILQQTDFLKAEIDSLRPLSKEQESRIMQKFRLDWNYHSNAIEGNSLDYGETVAFLMHGITAKGKPFKDYLDIKGHNEAIDFLLAIVHDNTDLTDKDIRSLHELLLGEPYKVIAETPEGYPTTKLIVSGRYKTSANHVRTATGAIHYYASPEEKPAKMQELMDWYREAKGNPAIHPVVLAAVFHHRFVSIHPFDDGNGRMTRLLMNLMLMQAHYPPVVIRQQERGTYYLTLSQADTGDIDPFVEFIAENVVQALELYLKGARGESLEEPSDLDKELALFKKEVEGNKAFFEVERSFESQQNIYIKSIKPLIDNIRETLAKFKSMFVGYSENKLSYYFLGDSEKKESYSTLDNYRGSDNELTHLIYNDVSFDSFTIVIKLTKFKNDTHSFDEEILLNFSFTAYTYTIEYGLKNYPQSYVTIKNRYHVYLDESEIQKISNYIGKLVLDDIKMKLNDSSASS